MIFSHPKFYKFNQFEFQSVYIGLIGLNIYIGLNSIWSVPPYRKYMSFSLDL